MDLTHVLRNHTHVLQSTGTAHENPGTQLGRSDFETRWFVERDGAYYALKGNASGTGPEMYRGTLGGTFTEQDGAGAPTFLSTVARNNMDMVLDADGIIHVVVVPVGVDEGVWYVQFDTNANTWGAREQITAETQFINLTPAPVSIELDPDDSTKVHVVWGYTSIEYGNNVTGSWVTEVIESYGAASMALRAANGILGLFYVPTSAGNKLLHARYRSGFGSADTWGDRVELATDYDIRIAEEISVRASDRAWHIAGLDGTEGAANINSVAYLEISATTNPSYTFTRGVQTAADLEGPANAQVTHPRVTVSADGEAVVILARHAGTNAYEAIGQTVRLSRDREFEPGPAWEAFNVSSVNRISSIMPTLIEDNEFVFLVVFEIDSITHDWVAVNGTTDRPPVAGITHDVVIGDVGFMLAGAMSKVDVTSSIPRISIATEQKRHFDFSELDTFSQLTFHQGRGERYLANPQAFYDSDNILTHIPNQATLALESYGVGASSSIAFDARSEASDTDSATLTWSHTTAGSDRLLIVGVSTKTADVSSVTYNGAAMTAVPSGAALFTNVEARLYYLIAPATGAHDVVVTLAAADVVVAGAVSWTNVHQSTPLGTAATATGTSAAPSVAVSSAATETVVAVLAAAKSIEGSGGGQTQHWNNSSVVPPVGGTVAVSVSEEGEGEDVGTVNVPFTTGGSDNLILVSLHINTVGVSPTPVVTWNSKTFTLLSTRVNNGARTSVYYLVGSDVATSTAGTVAVNLATVQSIGVSVVSFTGVNTTTPFGAVTTSAGNHSDFFITNIASAVGDLVFGAMTRRAGSFLGDSYMIDLIPQNGLTNQEAQEVSGDNQSEAIGGAAGTITATAVQTTLKWMGLITGGLYAGVGFAIKAAEASSSATAYGAGASAPGAASVTMSFTLSASDTWALAGVPIKPAATVSSTDMNGSVAKFFVYAGNLYALIKGTAAADNKLLVWDNTNSEYDTVAAGLDTTSGDPVDAANYGDDLWIAQGEAVNMWTFDESAAAWEDGGQPARALAVWDGKLWRADNIHEIYWSTDPDAGSPTWTLAAEISDSDTFITRLIVYQDALFVFKEDSVHVIERAGIDEFTARVISDENAFRHSDNGRGALVDKGILFWNRQDTVMRFDGSTTTPVGPDRGADTLGANFAGLPDDEQGKFISLTADGAFIYGALDPEDGSYPQVMVYNGIGWHSFWKGTSTGTNIRQVYFLPARTSTGVLSYPTLWFDYGETIRYIKLPRGSHNPLDDTTLEYVDEDAFLDLAWYDAGLPDVHKMFGSITLEQLSPADINQVQYHVGLQFDERTAEDTTWYLHNTVEDGWFSLPVSVGDVSTITYPLGDVHAGSLTEPVGLGGAALARKLRSRLRLSRNTATTVTPVLKSYTYRFITKPQPRYGWTLPLKAYDVVTRLDDQEELLDADEIRKMLYELRDSDIPVFFDDNTFSRSYRNSLLDPSFERALWDSVGTVTQSSFCSQHKKFSAQSQFIYTTSTSEAGAVSPAVGPVAAGQPIQASVFVLNQGPGFVTAELLINDVVVDFASVPPGNDWREAVLHGDTTSANSVVRMRVVKPATILTAGFHLDAAQIIIGAEERIPYIDGDRLRCYWEGKPGGSTSVRRHGYVAYVVGLNEVFRYRKTNSEDGTPRHDSEITVQLREVV